MTAVGMILRSGFRRRWRSWLALAFLVAMVSGVVLAAVAAGNRTASAFPRFVAAHGYDAAVYNNTPVPQIARLPEVSSVVTAPIAFNGTPRCTCTRPIDGLNLSVYAVPPEDLARTVNLVAGAMPDQSSPNQILASFNLEEDNGVHVGSVIRVPFYAASQTQAAFNETSLSVVPIGPVETFRVVGIEAAESEFPSGNTPSYGLYTTAAFARAVLPRVATGYSYLVTLRRGTADGERFKSELSSLGVSQLQNLDTPAALVAGGIHPQAVGWWILALLAALAGLAVVGQALSRQRAVEGEEYPTLRALGMGPARLVQLGLTGTLVIGLAGAAGAMVVAYGLSPIAPVGEARFAEASSGFSFDAVTLIVGGLLTLIVVALLGVWPAVRAARHDGGNRRTRQSAVAGFLGHAGAPATAVIGVRHAFERRSGPSSVPVSTALLGTVLAVAALCGTAVFSSSLTTLTSTPRLWGDDYQAVVYAQNAHDRTIARLERSPLVADLTLGTGGPVIAGDVHFLTFAMKPVRGRTLLSAVTGRLPVRPDEIALGTTTMRAIGTHVGSLIRLTPQATQGATKATAFRVVGTVALPTGIGADQAGMGTGGALTLAGYFAALCPPSARQVVCLTAAHQSVQLAAFVRVVAGRRGPLPSIACSARTPSRWHPHRLRRAWSTSARR